MCYQHRELAPLIEGHPLSPLPVSLMVLFTKVNFEVVRIPGKVHELCLLPGMGDTHKFPVGLLVYIPAPGLNIIANHLREACTAVILVEDRLKVTQQVLEPQEIGVIRPATHNMEQVVHDLPHVMPSRLQGGQLGTGMVVPERTPAVEGVMGL